MSIQQGELLKEEGIERVSKSNEDWLHLTKIRFRMWLSLNVAIGDCFAFDQFREYCKDRGYFEPKHPNVWGAVVRHALKAGFITQTNFAKKSSVTSAHARMLPLHRRVW